MTLKLINDWLTKEVAIQAAIPSTSRDELDTVSTRCIEGLAMGCPAILILILQTSE
jgi:hypothetical protein